MNVLKKMAQALTAFSFGAALGCLALYSVYTSHNQFPTIDEIQETQNISEDLPPLHYGAVEKSRFSAVRVLSISEETGYLASSTGTYITANERYYILTVSHGLVGDCAVTEIWANERFYPCQRFALFDVLVDYALIEIDEIPNLEPLKIPRDLPQTDQWKSAYATQSAIYYTGFPNNTGPLTFSGRIIGYHDDDYLYIDSFGWGGASGSGVFNLRGDLIGYVLAIDVGQTEFGINVLENIVVVVPTFKVDWATIL